MHRSIIFVGGSSGSGKTTLSTQLAKNLENSERFRFCDTVAKEAQRLGLPRLDVLQQWYYLQTLVAKNVVIALSDKTIIFDMHYSQPLSDDPDITFAKRSVSLSHPFCMALGNDFLRRMAQTNSLMFLFLLRTSEQDIQARLKRDSVEHNRAYMSALEMIRKEQSGEGQFYKKTADALKGFGANFTHYEIENAQSKQKNTLKKMLEIIFGKSRILQSNSIAV